MVDAPAIPRGILAKIRWVIDHHPWIWLLVGVEQIATDHILRGMAFLAAFGVNLFIYEMWESFSQLAKRIAGRRVAFAFIVIGAMFLAVGVTLLAQVPGAPPVSNAHDPVTAAPAALISNTNLRLLMRENQDPEQLSQTNIARWFAFRSMHIGPNGERSHIATYFFLTFDNPTATNYRRVFSSTHHTLQFQIVDMTTHSMVIAVQTDPTDAIIDFQISENPL